MSDQSRADQAQWIEMEIGDYEMIIEGLRADVSALALAEMGLAVGDLITVPAEKRGDQTVRVAGGVWRDGAAFPIGNIVTKAGEISDRMRRNIDKWKRS